MATELRVVHRARVWRWPFRLGLSPRAAVVAAGVTLIGAAPLFALAYVLTHAVNVPVFDQWLWLTQLEAWYDGHPDLRELFSPYNGHLLAAYYLVWYGLGKLTALNSIAEPVLSWSLLLVTLVLIVRVLGRAVSGRGTGVLIGVTIAWLLFSPRDIEILLSGPQLTSALSHVFVVSALVLLLDVRRVGTRLALAGAAGIIASLSHGSGFAVWPAGLVELFLGARREPVSLRTTRGAVLSWFVASAAAGAVLLALISTASAHLSPNVFAVADYSIIATGSPFSVDSDGARAFGLIVIAGYASAAIFSLAAARARSVALGQEFAAALISFGFFSIVATALSRATTEMGPLTPRYASQSALGFIGLLILLAAAGRRTSLSTCGLAAALALASAGVLTGYPWGERAGDLWRREAERQAYYVLTYRQQDEEALVLPLSFPDGSVVRNGASILERLRLSVFSTQPPTLTGVPASDSLGSVDALNGRHIESTVTISADHERSIVLEGWAVDPDTEGPGSAVFAVVDGDRAFLGRYGLERLDVADALRNVRYRWSGYYVSFSTKLIPPGRHSVKIELMSQDRRRIVSVPQAVELVVR